MTPEQFIKTWAGTQLKESASYITHFDDLCDLLNHLKPAHFDKTGERFTYQKGVTKRDPLVENVETKKGYADVWFDEHFAFEYKGANKHKDLAAAYRQLLLYKDALKNPPLLIVCDIEHYEVHTNFTNSVSKVYVFKNEDIASTKIIEGTRFTAVQLLDKLFRDPEALRPEQTIEGVTQDAAKKFTELADSMDKKHHIPHTQAARFLVKLVFCLFCEDVGLLPKGIFSKIVHATKDHPKEFSRHLRDLFGAMAEGNRMVWGETIYHFDGGLFAHSENDPDVVPFDGADTRILEDASKLNWADVDPSIFGTLFERALDIEGKRAQLGAHFTSRTDIETVIEPVLMSPLRREWEEVKSKTADYLDWNLPISRKKPEGSRRPFGFDHDEDKRAALSKLLHDFQDRLASITVLDPACGSGNFLYVSLSMLKDLEKQVITFALDVGIDDMEPRVHPSQLHGIEKDDFAFQLASIVVWIGYLQWKVKNGYAPAAETPILKPLNTIKQMDAILAMSDEPRAVSEPLWDAADVIVGNPPFLGDKKMRAE